MRSGKSQDCDNTGLKSVLVQVYFISVEKEWDHDLYM